MCNNNDDDDDDWRETTPSLNTHGTRRRRMTMRTRCFFALASHLVLMYASSIMCVVVVQGQVAEDTIMGTAAAAIREESSPQQHWIFTSDKPPPLRRYRRQLESSDQNRQAENTSTPVVDRELHDIFAPEVRLGTGDLIQSSLSYSYENKLTIQLNFKIQVPKEEVHRNRQQTGFLDTIQSGLQEAMKEEFELLNNRFLYDNSNNNMPNMAPAVVTNNDMGEEEAETMAEEEASYQTFIQHERRNMSFVRDDHPPTFDAVVQNRRHCPENVDCYFLQVTMSAFPERGDDDGEIKQALVSALKTYLTTRVS